jgi:RNAse (barnase) inhibitor barstar
MKIGPREYTEQESVIIEVYKSHIDYLQKEIDHHWNQLVEQLKITEEHQPYFDHLWDYVINDFEYDYEG